MKISLITVSFNSEKTIEHTFRSVKNQVIDNFELGSFPFPCIGRLCGNNLRWAIDGARERFSH